MIIKICGIPFRLQNAGKVKHLLYDGLFAVCLVGDKWFIECWKDEDRSFEYSGLSNQSEVNSWYEEFELLNEFESRPSKLERRSL